ncbi:MAG TPA: sulfatase-like hydrolase/transferase [Bryobacteraceae bacterium]|nr:sulfatase-like hydrolase/transferase [Bryobacteraceae bacterium]
MNRRELLKSSLLAATAAAAPPAPAQQTIRVPQPTAHNWPEAARETSGGRMPNVLWICADQQRFDTIAGLNNTHILTPNLRRFMDESVTFTHAFVQNPVCSPSRGSFLTGRYPHTTGLRANGQRIRPSEQLVPRTLADHGYTCGLSGKLHLSPCAGGRNENRIDDGYQVFWWSHDLSDQWPGKNMWRVWLKDRGVKWPDPPPKTEAWGVPVDPIYTQTAWCSDMAIDFIRQQRQFNPWLFSVNIFQPHHPFWPTKDYLAHYDPAKLPSPRYQEGELDGKPVFQRVDHQAAYGGTAVSFAKTDDLTHRQITAAYYAMIEQVDTEVGRMLKVLENTGQAENTIVIYMSDHGEMLGDHGIYLKGPYFYDCMIRVPLMIRWPGRYKAGLRSDALVEMVDLAPTLLEAAGVPVPAGMQGRSLTPVLTGTATRHRDSIYSEHFDSSFLYDPPPMGACVRTERYKLSYFQHLAGGELYDLEKDPGEVENLWASPGAKGVRQEMMEKLMGRMIDTVDPLPERKTLW